MKTYHLVSGGERVASGPTPPEYDADRRAYLVGDTLVTAASPADFTIEVEDIVVRRTLMTPIRFKAQFTIPERLAIGAARAYTPAEGQTADPAKVQAKQVLDILFGDLDDPRLEAVDVADSAVIQGIDFCAYAGIVTEARATTIKLGISE